MSSGIIAFFAIAVIVVMVIVFLISSYNSFVKTHNRVKTQWAQIDVQLKRRFDLIPNLVESVKGYAKHENELFDRIAAARSKMAGAGNPQDAMKANAQLTSALSGIFAIAEAYPNLKADANFIQLQESLKETENKIAYARQFYNDTVLIYKDRIMMFPNNILAGVFGFKEEPFFEADEAEKSNIKVTF